MDDKLIYVSPERLYLSYISNNGTAKGWTSLQPKVGYIPILRANLEAFKSEQLNNISRQNNGKVNQVYNAMTKSTKSSDSDANTTNQGTKEKKYQVLQQFLPTSLDQQLFMITIVLTEELNLNKSNKLLKEVNTLNETMRINILEEFLSLLVSDYDEIVSGWTVCELVKSEQDETLLFVRFNPSKTQEFLRFIRKFSKSKYIGIHYDENTKRFINDNAQQEEEVPEGEEQSVVKLMKMAIDKCEREHSGESGQDDEESRTDYKIDYNTLLDIPRDSLDQLGKEIIDFRTKVISIEKEKQVRQQYEDNERRRKHMAQLFNKLLKSRNLDQMREEDEESSDDDEDDDDDIVMETKRKEADDRRYREMLRKLNTEIEPTLQRLHKQLVSAQEYEARLVEHREESIRNVQRTAQDTYYDHHRSFKDQEAQRDQRDRELHPSVTVSYAAPKKKKKETIKINLAFKKAMETSTKEPEPDATATDRYQLRKLHVVEDLVKEYLGVEDEEVVLFVYDILEGDDDDEQKQKKLTEELEDLFDKEAPEFTQKLFSRF